MDKHWGKYTSGKSNNLSLVERILTSLPFAVVNVAAVGMWCRHNDGSVLAME